MQCLPFVVLQKRISSEVTKKVREYMRVLMRKRTSYDKQKDMASLPPALAKDLMSLITPMTPRATPVESKT